MNDDINPIVPDAPKFDLFATEVEDNLKEELAKGTFQWTNKYTKGLGVHLIVTALLSAGVWYGHYEATKTPAVNTSALSALRAAFGGAGGFGAGTGTGAGAGTGAPTGGFGGSRITGTIKSVKGSTVTVTLDDPTQASSLVAGDAARVTDTGAATAGTTTGGTKPSTGKTTAAPKGTSGSKLTPAPASTSGTGRGAGVFSNPALTACLTKAGITIASGTRPNFQDPKTAAALQKCFTQLGITRGGGFGGGAAPTPTATK